MNAKRTVHTHILSYICDKLDEGLNSPKCRQIRKHLATCSDCTDYLKSLKLTIELYRRYPAPKLSEKAKKKLRTRFRR